MTICLRIAELFLHVFLFSCIGAEDKAQLVCSNSLFSLCKCVYYSDSFRKLNCSNYSELKSTLVTTLDKTITFNEVIFENTGLTQLKKNQISTAHYRTVEIFTVKNNRISEIEHGCFENMKMLKTLNLARNQLTTIKSEWFVGLESTLDTLDLIDNKISEIPEKAFAQLNKLKQLKLDRNPITRIFADSFFGLRLLVSLSLNYTLLSEVAESALSHLINLEALSIRFGLLERLPELIVPMLKHVYFDGNLIETVHMDTFIDTPELETISFDSMPKLSMFLNSTFSYRTLKKVKYLSISNCPLLRHIPKSAFQSLGSKLKLHTVNFANNNLTKLPPDLLQWFTVEKIFLAGNPWNCTCPIAWMQDSRVNIVDDPRCAYPNERKNQPIRKYAPILPSYRFNPTLSPSFNLSLFLKYLSPRNKWRWTENLDRNANDDDVEKTWFTESLSEYNQEPKYEFVTYNPPRTSNLFLTRKGFYVTIVLPIALIMSCIGWLIHSKRKTKSQVVLATVQPEEEGETSAENRTIDEEYEILSEIRPLYDREQRKFVDTKVFVGKYKTKTTTNESYFI